MGTNLDQRLDGELSPAPLSDRIVAFCADGALFLGGYFLTLKLFFPAYSVFINPRSGVWSALWVALFILYQAFFSADGRVSLGKRLVGIRIVSGEGEPLSLGQGLIRSFLYLISSIFELGFAWALFNPGRQCWHDLAVGSIVVDAREKPRGTRLALRGLAAACLAVLAGSAYWNYAVADRYHEIMNVSYARVGLSEISELQKTYYARNGRYATSLEQLAPLSSSPRAFLSDMETLFDLNTVSLSSQGRDYTISARVSDESGTLVAMRGP